MLLAENVGRFHAKFWDHELLKHQVTHRPSSPYCCAASWASCCPAPSGCASLCAIELTNAGWGRLCAAAS